MLGRRGRIDVASPGRAISRRAPRCHRGGERKWMTGGLRALSTWALPIPLGSLGAGFAPTATCNERTCAWLVWSAARARRMLSTPADALRVADDGARRGPVRP